MIDFSKAVDYLLEHDYLVVLNNEIVITGKFRREFNPLPKSRVEPIIEVKKWIDDEELYNKFIIDAEIPHRVTATNGKQYTVRQFSPGIAKKLRKIIDNTDYSLLTQSVRNYYKSNIFKKTLKNYIEEAIWKDEYEAYKKAKEEGTLSTILSAGSGGNRFED